MTRKRPKRRSGFGAIESKHDREFVRGLKSLQESLDTAESLARNGDCYALMDEAARAFQIRGELDAHRESTSADARGRHARTWVAAGTRLNFLRQSLKRCVQG